MKVKEIEIKNFRTIRALQMEDLGHLVVLVGENGSGKTCVLEALDYFFRYFSGELESPCEPVDELLWHRRGVTRPIDITLKLELSEAERDRLFSPEVATSLGLKVENVLTVRRQLQRRPEGDFWKTVEVRLGDQSLVARGVPTGKLVERASSAMAEKAEETPAEPTEEAVIPGEETKAPSEPEVPQEAKFVMELLRRIADSIKGQFILISAVRSAPPSDPLPLGIRAPFIAETRQSRLVDLHESESTADQDKFSMLEEALRAVLPSRWRLDFAGGRVSIWEENFRIPIWLVGGGLQEYVSLTYQIYDQDAIFGLEEPEAHFHTKYSKAMFGFLTSVSAGKQVFLATHSEHFLDINEPSNNWIFERRGTTTRARQATKAEELLEALDMLGAEPADRFYPNRLLLVAGYTEGRVVPIWLKTLKIPTGITGVDVSPFEGERDWRKAAARIEAHRGTQTALFLMVDHSHGEDLKRRAVELGLPEDHCLVLDGTIEDCYPVPILEERLKHLYGAKIGQFRIDPDKPRVDEIKRILKENLGILKRNTTWKVGLGEEVAKRMSADHIPEPVKVFLRRVAGQ